MPRTHFERGLERVVVRGPYAVELQNGAEIRKRIILVNVGYDIQLSPLAAHIPHLKHGSFAKPLLDLQVVISKVGRAEILVHCKQVQSGITDAQRIGANSDAGEDGGSPCLNNLPVIRAPGIGGNGIRTKWIALNTLCRGNWRAEVQERIHIDLVKEDPETAAHNEVSLCGWLICKTNAWSKVIPVGRENGVRNLQPCARNKDRDVVPVTGQRSKIFIAKT